jgi:hypothetical protein
LVVSINYKLKLKIGDNMLNRLTNICILLCIVFTTIFINRANAIPAFARKYKFSCSTCHVAVPKLKDYGDEFAGNGFMIPDGEEPKRYYVNTGDDSLLLMRELPIAVRFDAYVQASDRENAKTDFQAPFGLKLLSGGPISKHVSYYFYFYIDERGEVAGVEDAIIHFNNIGNSEFDLALGQFQVSDPLFKRELRMTFEDYMIYKAKPGLSQANLTYDRGIMATYGWDFGLDLTGIIVNGNGIKDAGADRLFDIDNGKSFVFRAIQGFGLLNVGGFIYSGKETLSDSANANNNIFIIGPDITLANETWELNGQYLYREDDNPQFLSTGSIKNKLKGGFAELVYMPQGDRSRFIYSLLYNRIDSDGDLYDYETATLSISHMPARNLRILSEITYDLITEKSRLTFGVASAF